MEDINYFVYRSKDDSIFLHHIKTPFSKFSAEKKMKYATSNFVEAHNRYEIIYLLTGEVGYCVDGVDYLLKPGDILIIPPMKIHKRTLFPEKDYERYNIQFHLGLISSPSMHLNNILGELLNVGNEYLLHLPDQIVKKYALDVVMEEFKKYQKYEHNKDIVLMSCILNLAIEINNVLLNEHFTEKKDFIGTEQQRIVLRKVINYVDENLCSKIMLDDIAKALYVNKYYLSHYFKEKMGISLKRYITMKKLFHADFLINNGDSPTAVALKLGYSNYSTFYYAYKKQFDREPSKLRPYIENYKKK